MMNSFQRITVPAVVILLAAPALTAQAGNPEAAAVRKTIEDHYFKAQSTGDGSHLKGTFIDEGRMMWIADGQPADEAKRKRRVVNVDVTGDAAVAKVELDYPDTRITDYFALLKVGNDWKIVHKWFHRAVKKG